MKSNGEPWRRLVTADGTLGLAMHRFDSESDSALSSQPTVLLSHATGFHAHCYRSVARALQPDWTAIGIDHRGHGYTAPDPNDDRLPEPPTVEWAIFGDDVVTAGTWLAERFGRRVIGFGHSMGAAALVLAAARFPSLFSALVLYEPIAPSGFIPLDGSIDPDGNRLAAGAARRRPTFASIEAAIENYSSKPPFNMINPEVLSDYVTHGFAPCPEGVTLRCRPEYEAATFNAALTNGVWEVMEAVTTPTIIASGRPEADQPSAWSAAIAERLPNSELVVFEDQNHFGPFTDPEACAALIERAGARR